MNLFTKIYKFRFLKKLPTFGKRIGDHIAQAHDFKEANFKEEK